MTSSLSAEPPAVSDEETDEAPPPRGGLSLFKALGLAAACAFLAGALVYLWTQTDEPSASSVDVGFAQDMISHHEQAVQMALMELSNGSSPVVRGFAQEIVTFQQYEIGRMEQMLRSWGYDRSQRSPTAMAWMGEPVPVAAMPGLATDEQMQSLQDARGSAADALFLQLMATHHRAGVHMAEVAAAEADDADLRDLASRMATNQAVEINEYRRVAEREGLPVTIDAYEPPAADATHEH